MKGVSPLVSHSSLLIISIIGLGLIVGTVSDYLFDTEKTLTKLELNNIANKVKTNFIKVYSLANTTSGYVTGIFELSVAEKVGGKKVLLDANADNFTLSATFNNEKIEIVRSLNIDANISGIAYLPASLVLEKINGNITIRLVE